MLRRILFVLFLMLMGASGLSAQSTTDIITGRILGPNGAPITGAAIRATAVGTELERSAVSNAQGRFTIVFPQGEGQYRLEVSALGLTTVTRELARIGDEEVLIAEVQMDVRPVEIAGIDVTARRPIQQVGGREPGGTERSLTAEALDRLPIDPTDLAAIAALTPGVIALADSMGASAFSVLGQGPAGNQVTLDGASFGGAGGAMGSGVPQEAVRMTRVITNTYDVSRGQFSGGQIATTSRGGTNQFEGSFNYSLRDPSLQWTAENGPFAGSFRQNRLSGGVGGPIIENKLFYFGSVQLQRRSEGLQSLLSADQLSLERLGASPDSVLRFLGSLSGMGLYDAAGVYPQDRVNDNVSLLGRLDYNLTDLQTLTLRADGQFSGSDNFRSGALGIPQSGGENKSSGGGLMATLTSRFGNGWINEFRGYFSENRRETVPSLILPDGRVRVSSDLDDGTRGITTLSFGGGSVGNESLDRTLEVTNELSLLLGLTHRVRIGGMFNSTSSRQEMSNNRFGTFTFNSIADLEAGMPATFTRSLFQNERKSGGLNAALYVGDTWRATDRLQLTYGLRGEASSVAEQPDYNPLIEERFGFRTDAIPSELRVSPRVGFSYTLGQGGGFGGGGATAGGMGFGGLAATVIRGGFGEFRSRPSWGLFSSAVDATGLPSSQSQLYCVGSAVPTPDWDAYLLSAEAIPTSCIGASSAAPSSGRGTNVTVFNEDFAASRSWRASLGFQRRLFGLVGMTFDATYALGVGQQGVRDLNLRTTPQFTLAAEGGRPVYAAADAIVPSTGSIGFLGSRVHSDLGQVSEIHSELESKSVQLTLGLNGALPVQGLILSGSYTYGRSTDQGSGGGWGFGSGFGGGGGGIVMLGGGGGGSASLPITVGNPNQPEWGTSDFERRHSLMGTVSKNFAPWLDVTLIGRATSGSPFTPLVGGDINGDGARNDPAFIFNPAGTADAALAADMSKLLSTIPSSARECLVSQMGSTAGRNSCSSPWNYGLDLRAQIQPNIPGLNRRLSISLDATNALVGIDQLLHGSGDMRGWGQQTRVDPILLYPRGFDPSTQSFRYEVNERFGAPRQSGLAIQNPFQIQITGRLAVGAQRGGFGFGGFGGGFGGGGGGIRIGIPGGFGGGGGGQVLLGGPAAAAAANPISRILEMGNTLDLTAAQRTQLDSIGDGLSERQRTFQETLREEMLRTFQRNPENAMQALQPRLAEARQMLVEALAEAQAVLTPEQWAQLPADITEPPAVPSGATRIQRVPGQQAPGAGRGPGSGGGAGGAQGEPQQRPAPQVRPNQ